MTSREAGVSLSEEHQSATSEHSTLEDMFAAAKPQSEVKSEVEDVYSDLAKKAAEMRARKPGEEVSVDRPQTTTGLVDRDGTAVSRESLIGETQSQIDEVIAHVRARAVEEYVKKVSRDSSFRDDKGEGEEKSLSQKYQDIIVAGFSDGTLDWDTYESTYRSYLSHDAQEKAQVKKAQYDANKAVRNATAELDIESIDWSEPTEEILLRVNTLREALRVISVDTDKTIKELAIDVRAPQELVDLLQKPQDDLQHMVNMAA